MKSRRSLILLGVLILWMWGGRAAHAHANLLRSEPAANAVLTAAPAEIRLWFSEPLEPRFSHIHLFDAAGRRIEMLDSAVDAGDAFQMFLTLPPLADGVYTVAWANVSTADGHPSEGSFPFTIGEGTAAANITHDTSERLPIEAALVRSFYIYSLALFIGGVGFWLLVWCSALPNGDAAIEKRLMALIGLAWLLTGLANVLHLFLQTSLASGTTLIAAITSPSLLNVLSTTRYGSLWWVRAGLWLTAGIVLYFTRASAEAYRRALLWGVLVLSTVIAFTYSLFSHADSTASALVDWLHLLATGLWVGGLAQFINALLALRQSHDTTQVVSALTAWFSNLARAAVFTLAITGMYSAWLHVGSVEALLTTLYGQTLLLKLVLFVPLLLIGALNLVLTVRRLHQGQTVWVGRLRALIGAELALTVGIVVSVGAMTSLSPGRSTLALRQLDQPIEAEPMMQMQVSGETMVHLFVTPGWVGENTFSLDIMTMESVPITDASLVRLRFENRDTDLGRSELRPTLDENGEYTITGANLSVPGRWRIRATIQRPQQFDVVVDFNFEVPPMPVSRELDLSVPAEMRGIALVLVGVAALIGGGMFLAANGLRPNTGGGLLAALLIVGGAGLLLMAQALLLPLSGT